MKGKGAVSIGPALGHPYVSTEGAGLPEVASASSVSEPGEVPPRLMAAVPTSGAWVDGAGCGGGLVVNPVKVHWAMTSPQTGEGGGGSVLTVRLSLAELPVSVVPTNTLSEVLSAKRTA